MLKYCNICENDINGHIIINRGFNTEKYFICENNHKTLVIENKNKSTGIILKGEGWGAGGINRCG